MHVVHVGAAFLSESTNGVNRAVSLYARYQRALGHEVTMVTFSGAAGDARDRETGIRMIALEGSRSPFALGERGARFFRNNAACGDVYHFHSAFLPSHCYAAALVPVPYVVSPHGAYLPSALQRSRWKKRVFRYVFDRRYLVRACAVHALTEIEKEAVKRYAQTRRIVVIPNPAEPVTLPSPDERSTARASLGLKSDEICVLFVGRLDVEHKGLDFLIEGFRTARARAARARRLRLILAGPPAGPIAVARLLLRGDGDGIVVLPPAYGKEKRKLFASADMVASPSRWEGLPNLLLEALSYGVPIVITRETGLADFVEANGAGVVAEPSSAGVAEAITLLAQSLDRDRKRIAEATRRSFSPTSTARGLIDAYRLLSTNALADRHSP